MPRKAVGIHHVKERLQNPHRPISANRCPFLVVGNEIHYFRSDSVHDEAFKKIPKERVDFAGFVLVDPLIPFEMAGIGRESYDHPDIPNVPPGVIDEVKEHMREQVRELKGHDTAQKMRFRNMW